MTPLLRFASCSLCLLVACAGAVSGEESNKEDSVPKKSTTKPDPALIAGHEAAAIAACKTYAEAQDIYRRTDWDSDGILEYSQAISGDFSLYEKDAGTGNVTLVDAAFAAAAGMPAKLKDGDIPPLDAKTKEQIEKLVPKLSAEEYTVREAASKAIEALGEKAIRPLDQILENVNDPEAAARCRALASRLRKNLMMKRWKTTRTASPKNGYCFKILTGQGPDAPGGRKTYVINGNMTLGYGLLAFPAAYGLSGRRSFIINNTGTVYEKDFGPKTHEIADKMTEYNPDRKHVVAE